MPNKTPKHVPQATPAAAPQKNPFAEFHTLLNFSGGFDSLYCLWDYARRGEPLFVHFCRLRNFTGRVDFEARAVRNCVRWIKGQYPDYTFALWTSAYDYGNMSIIQDKEVIGFQTGVALRNRQLPIQNVIISSNKEDISRTEYYMRSEANRYRLIFGVGGREVRILYPIKDLTKEDIIRALPAGLRKLAWWCRTPVRGAVPGEGTPCGSCQTCQKVLPVLAAIEKEEAQEVTA